MEISCDIIRDLLPLYAEDMVSQASRDMVDGHLCGCDSCTKELAALQKVERVPVEVDTTALKKVGNSIRRRRILTAVAAIMTLLSLTMTVCIYLFVPYYLSAEEAIEGVELREDGGLAIDYARGITGTSGHGAFDENNYGILCRTSRYDWYVGQMQDAELEGMTREALENYIAEKYEVDTCTQKEWDRFFNIHVEYGTFETKDGERLHQYNSETWTEENGEWIYKHANRNQWYLNPSNGDVDTLLWDAGVDYPNSVLAITSNACVLIFWGSTVLAVIFFAISRGTSGFWKEIVIRIAILLGSVAFSTLLATGGKLMILQGDMYVLKGYISTESIFVCLTALVWHQLHRLSKQDKGI